MKLCIPCTEPNGLDSAYVANFPSASHWLIFDTETRTHTIFDVESEGDILVDAVLCGSIHRPMLRALAAQGIVVYATEAPSIAALIASYEAGDLTPVPVPQGCGRHLHGSEGKQGCCGGHQAHDDAEHECCGGHGHDDPDHECCGGHGHDDPDHECCGGHGETGHGCGCGKH